LINDLLVLGKSVGLRPLGPAGRVWTTPREPAVSFVRRQVPWLLPLVMLISIVLGLDLYWSYKANQDTQLPPPPLIVPKDEPAGGWAPPPDADGYGAEEVAPKAATPKTPQPAEEH
jgi:hypothetical protein